MKNKVPQDIEEENEIEELGEEETEPESDLKTRDFTDLIKQHKSEWEQGWWFMKPKWDEWQLRLKLYNNQKRDKESVGDTTLFSVFQTVIASLYQDRLSVTFSPSEIGDD